MTKWIFNRNGRAAALDGGDAVYDSHGNLCFWVYGNNLYNNYTIIHYTINIIYPIEYLFKCLTLKLNYCSYLSNMI